MLVSEKNDLEIKWHDLLFGIRRSRRYHFRRRRFFEGWNKFTSAATLIFGATAVITVLSKINQDITIFAASIVTIVSIIDLIVGTSKSAWLHGDLARRFTELEKEMEQVSEPTDQILKDLTGKRLDIEADEPPVLRNLDIRCHNELAKAMGYSKDDYIKIPWYKNAIASFINWD